MNKNAKNIVRVKSVWLTLPLILLFFLAQANPTDKDSAVYWSVPAAPTNLTVNQATSTQFLASWTASTGATSYRIDVSTVSDFSHGNIMHDSITNGPSATAQLVTGLTAGTTYYFRVRAVNADGKSPNSFIKSLVTIPSAPYLFNALTVTPTNFVADWIPVSGATGYRVDVSLSSAFSSFVYSNLDAGRDTIFTIKKLTPVTTYYYRVRALNSLGMSANSSVKSIQTSTPNINTPIVKAATNVKPTGFTANWSPNGPIANVSFYVEVALNPVFDHIENSITSSDTSINILFTTGSARVYYYRIRAHNQYGFSDYSDASPPVYPNSTSAERNNSLPSIESELKIYPNPIHSGDPLTIEVTNLNAQTNVGIHVTSLEGDKSISFYAPTDGNGTLNTWLPTSALGTGTYVVKVQGKTFRLIVH